MTAVAVGSSGWMHIIRGGQAMNNLYGWILVCIFRHIHRFLNQLNIAQRSKHAFLHMKTHTQTHSHTKKRSGRQNKLTVVKIETNEIQIDRSTEQEI